MALMIGRYIRFYGESALAVMQMPIRRFLALHRAIPILEAEEEARALSVAHHGKPDERLRELLRIIKGSQGVKVEATNSIQIIQSGVGEFEDVAGNITAERERQKAAADKLKAEREAWLAQQRQRTQAS